MRSSRDSLSRASSFGSGRFLSNAVGDGLVAATELVDQAIADELAKNPGPPAKRRAADLFKFVMTRPDFEEFLTTVAYEFVD